MKLTPFQVSLGISALCHLAGAAAYIWVAAHHHHPAILPEQETVIPLTLIATPAKPAEPPKIEPIVLASAAQPTPEIMAPMKPPVKISVSAGMGPPQPPVKVAAKPAPPRPSAPIRSERSSPEPSLVATAPVGGADVKAEPNYLKNPEPPYPAAARRRHQEGVVLISVHVTAQGHAEKVAIKQSSGYSLLDEAALQAVRLWEFTPGRIGTMAVASEIEVPVHFALKD
jgi:protein TonB